MVQTQKVTFGEDRTVVWDFVSGTGRVGAGPKTGAHFVSSEYKIINKSDPANVEMTLAYAAEPSTELRGLTVKVYKPGVSSPVYNKAAAGTASFTQKLKSTEDGIRYTFQLVDGSKIIDTSYLTIDMSKDSGTSAGGTVSRALPVVKDACEQPKGSAEYQFCETLFGDKISAQDYFIKAYYWAVAVAIIGAVGMIIWAGYKYALSKGSPSEIGNAKEMIISAVVGLTLLLLSFVILRFLGINVVSQAPSATNTTTNAGAATTNAAIQMNQVYAYIDKSSKAHITYSLNYASDAQWQLQTSFVLYDGGGAVINPSALKSTTFSKTLPKALAGATAYKVEGQYTKTSEVKRATKALVIWKIVDPKTGVAKAQGSQEFNPIDRE